MYSNCEATIYYTTLHHFLSISLDEQQSITGHILVIEQYPIARCRILSYSLPSQCGINYILPTHSINATYLLYSARQFRNPRQCLYPILIYIGLDPLSSKKNTIFEWLKHSGLVAYNGSIYKHSSSQVHIKELQIQLRNSKNVSFC